MFLFLSHVLFILAATRQPSRNSLADILLKYNLIDAETCLLWFSVLPGLLSSPKLVISGMAVSVSASNV